MYTLCEEFSLFHSHRLDEMEEPARDGGPIISFFQLTKIWGFLCFFINSYKRTVICIFSFELQRNMHRLTTGLVLVGICVVLLALCTYGLLRYYREKSVSCGYSLTIYVTW